MFRLRMIAALTVVLAFFSSPSGSDKRHTGEVAGNRFRDNSYGFTIEKYDNWKFGKIANEDPAKPRLLRCLMSQKTVAYPSDYLDNQEKFTLPAISVFVDTSAMVLEAYAAELANHKSTRASRKELAKDFPILAKQTFIEQGPTTIDGQRALALHFREDYEVQLYNRVKDQYKLKEDAILGDLYVTKRGNSVYLLSFTCEREIYRAVNEEAQKIIMSVDLDPPADSVQGAATGAPGR